MKTDHAAIQVLENFLGTKLPTKYADFLIDNDGEPPEKGSFDIPGEGEDVIQYFFPLVAKNKTDTLPYQIKIFQNRIPEGTLPIACDPGGNLILLCLKGQYRERIYFWNHETDDDEDISIDNSSVIELAKDFSSFFNNLS